MRGRQTQPKRTAWSTPSPRSGRGPEARPSLGVVTFNRKQADLIEDAIERRAPKFLPHARNGSAIEDGEDMGFFVKNVENVQGDERDVIVFSSTFGRNKHVPAQLRSAWPDRRGAAPERRRHTGQKEGHHRDFHADQ